MSIATDLADLTGLHAALLAAVADIDIERLATLLAQRDDLIASLTVAYASASAPERTSWQPVVADLAAQQRALTDAFTAARDKLALELARASAHGASAPPEAASGSVNLRA